MDTFSIGPVVASTAPGAARTEQGDAKFRAAAEAFEAAFLAEMLRMSGVGKVPDAFGGGAGEQGFSDFLTREYAQEIARSRSIGLADHIERHLRERA